MSTLRRELIQVIKSTLMDDAVFCSDGLELEEPYSTMYQRLAERLADAVIELRGFSAKPEFDKSRAGLEWSILEPGADIELGPQISEILDAEAIKKEALDAFERDLQLPANWYWYGKGSEDKALEDLREFVVQEYKKDPSCFQGYQTWRNQPYARGAMSNLAIKRYPENFRASWSDFLASNAMYGKKDKKAPDTDAHGSPITY